MVISERLKSPVKQPPCEDPPEVSRRGLPLWQLVSSWRKKKKTPKMNMSVSFPKRGAFCDPSVRQISARHMAGTLTTMSRLHPLVTDMNGSFLVLPHGSDATDKGLASPSCSVYFLRPGGRTRQALRQ
ncbi:hypothetical protein GGI35DRAFT_17314 [Trichoderma velutinum]